MDTLTVTAPQKLSRGRVLAAVRDLGFDPTQLVDLHLTVEEVVAGCWQGDGSRVEVRIPIV